MLYLAPPYHIMDGLTLMPDHADVHQWYYMPGMPRLTMHQDAADGRQVPAIQLITYRGAAGTGGFLNFDVNLGVDQDVLEETRRSLMRVADLRDPPRLGPVPLMDGTVKVMMLGRSSDAPPPDPNDPDAANDRSIFEVKFAHSAKPALFGNNQAAFSVELNQEAVTVVDRALRGEMAPIGVVYSLDFLGLRPAYSVRVKADWDRVYHHFEESFGFTAIFMDVQIQEVLDELIENRVIVIEADTFVVEGPDAQAVITRRDEALSQVREMVTDAFFEPTLDPIADEEDAGDRISDTVMDLHRIASGTGCFRMSRLDLTRIDRKTLNVNISERVAVKRSMYPQGHLRGLARFLRDPGFNVGDFIIPVDLDNPWFQRRKVRVVSRADWVTDNIASINVDLKYGNDVKSVMLEPTKDSDNVDWNSILENGSMKRDVEVSYTVNFAGVDSSERPLKLLREPFSIIGEDVEIQPREIYSISPVTILALNFPWERYPHIQVRLQYRDEENGIRMDDTLLLKEDDAEKSWPLFLRDPQKTAFGYQLIYRAADHKDQEEPWKETQNEQLVIRDPFPQKLVLEVVPAINWGEVDRVFVDLKYVDEPNNVHKVEFMQFTKEESVPQRFVADLMDPKWRRVSYKVTLLFTDGRLFEVPESETQERRIFVRQDMRGHQMVTVCPDRGLDFVQAKLKSMEVLLRYRDVQAGLEFNDLHRFTQPDQEKYFEYDYVDPHIASYDYRVKYLFTDGLARETDWRSDTLDKLTIGLD